MNIPAIPFTFTDWSQREACEYKGETGTSYWWTFEQNGLREALARCIDIPGLKGCPAPQVVGARVVRRQLDQRFRRLGAPPARVNLVIQVEAGQDLPQRRIVGLQGDRLPQPDLCRHVAPFGHPGLADLDARGRVGRVQVVGHLELLPGGGDVAQPLIVQPQERVGDG